MEIIHYFSPNKIYFYISDFFCESTRSNKKIIYQQILEYYNFHQQFKNYYIVGYNIDASKKKEKLYFINPNWISIWKAYVDYEKAIKFLDSYEKFDDNIRYNFDLEDFNYNYCLTSGNTLEFFLSKTIIDVDDFDCLINEKTYNLFSQIFKTESSWHNIWSNTEYIKGILYERMLLLFIKNYKRIKVFYKEEIEGNFELIQLNIDFLFDGSNNRKNNVEKSYNTVKV